VQERRDSTYSVRFLSLRAKRLSQPQRNGTGSNMSMHKLASAAILATLICSGYAQDQAVAPQEIQDTWIGKTVAEKLPNGGPFSMQLRTDGSGKLVAGGHPLSRHLAPARHGLLHNVGRNSIRARAFLHGQAVRHHVRSVPSRWSRERSSQRDSMTED
jgi:hypothetical protein